MTQLNPNRAGAAKRDEFFQGWFNNQMTILLFALQSPKPLGRDAVKRLQFFLYDLEHHFLRGLQEAGVRRALRYLKCFLCAYPIVSMKHAPSVVRSVARIYEAAGLEFHFKFDPVSERGLIHAC